MGRREDLLSGGGRALHPAHHFEGGKANPEFRTKPQIALELVERAVEMEIPFRAVIGDILYGEHRKLKEGFWIDGSPTCWL